MQFGNDKSRIIRGLAIILMVTGHSCPGKIIPFAVPLFSFLVGYGYEFAKQKDIAHSFKRIKHLLLHFWFILFAICLPIAVFFTHYKFSVSQLALNMFGCWGGFNFYCWYVYFYILAMLSMPLLSRIIDRFKLKALIPMVLLFLATYVTISLTPNLNSHEWISKIGRYCKLMPIVLTAYWMAHEKIFNKVHLEGGLITGTIATSIAIGVYLLRYYDEYKIADFLTTPVIIGAISLLTESLAKTTGIIHKIALWAKTTLTDLGIKSMHIWFLHSLFFAHSTKGLFAFLKPLMQTDVSRVLTVLICSWILSIATMKLYTLLEKAVSRLRLLRFKNIFRLGSSV